MYEVIIKERRFIHQLEPQVEVSFLLPFRDWSLLEKSDAWCLVEKFLQELRNKHSQTSRQDPEGKWG